MHSPNSTRPRPACLDTNRARQDLIQALHSIVSTVPREALSAYGLVAAVLVALILLMVVMILTTVVMIAVVALLIVVVAAAGTGALVIAQQQQLRQKRGQLKEHAS